MSSNKNRLYVRIVGGLILLSAAATAIYFGRPYWLEWIGSPLAELHDEGIPLQVDEVTSVRMSEQACANLGLCVEACKLQTYWRKIQTTGVIVDRPGFTDRGVISPIDCVVSKVHAYEGDIVQPGEKLFTLTLISEHLQETQSDFFKALSEIGILQTEIARIDKLVNSGVIPEKRIIQLRQEIKRQQVQVDAQRQELISRGLNEEQIKEIQQGNFIRTIEVTAPQVVPQIAPKPKTLDGKISQTSFRTSATELNDTYLELQELKVELGQQVKAGELLAVLANHNYLYINGHGFKKEAGNIARAAELKWQVDVEFIEDTSDDWPELDQPFQIRHLSNSIDVDSRTFDFFVPLTNQSRSYTREGRKFVVWRFRPGQRVRIHVPVEKLEDVIVVPNAAVVSEGPESYVFQQNGDIYNRIAVHVLHKDRLNTVIANDGSVLPGFVLAKNSAASLNRVLKVQTASGQNAGNFHVHADGSVHANH